MHITVERGYCPHTSIGRVCKPDARLYERLGDHKINALVSHSPTAAVVLLTKIKDWRFFATIDGHAPYGRRSAIAREVEPLSIRRLLWLEPSILRYLNGRAATGRHLPYLQSTAPVRSEVDPPTVARPCRNNILSRVICQPPRLAAFTVYYEDVRVALGPTIKRDLASIGRPTRRTCERTAKGGQLNGILPFAAA